MRRLALGLLLVLFTAGPALAQPVADAKETPTWLAAVLAVLILVLLAIGSFMGSRRGHQD
jgi:uncharacterized membrane protein